MAVCAWAIQPSEFWRMTPAEWWRVYECKRPRVAGDGLSQADIERLTALMESTKEAEDG